MSEMQKLYDDIVLKTQTLEKLSNEIRALRNQETDALNRLNEAQKAFDEHVEAIKKSASLGSDWNKARQPIFRVP